MTTKHYTEQDFEEHIEENLLNSGYHKGLPTLYDKELCLMPDEIITFIQDTQPKEWEYLQNIEKEAARCRRFGHACVLR